MRLKVAELSVEAMGKHHPLNCNSLLRDEEATASAPHYLVRLYSRVSTAGLRIGGGRGGMVEQLRVR